MSSPEYKRRRKEARSKFRKLWKGREAILKEKNGKNEEETISNDDNLKNYEDLKLLNGNTEFKKIHVPKTKYALAFGYMGTSYHGYQKQVEYKTGEMDKVKTIEGTMENCLIQIGAIDESYRNMNHKLQISKSSRTDKGVHAACTYIGGRFNINLNEQKSDVDESNNKKTSEFINCDENSGIKVTGLEKLDEQGAIDREELLIDSSKGDSTNEEKLGISEETKEEVFVKRLNSVLPRDIRCFKIQRVTKGFDARVMCSKRKYEYLFPKWLLSKKLELPNEKHECHFKKLEEYISKNINNYEKVKAVKAEESLYKVQGKYVEVEDDMERLSEILKRYEGTHDFHNFTVRQKMESNSTQRYIEKIKVKQCEIEEMKVVRITILGQSFLYNQIRKMMCLALQEYLKVAPKNVVKYSLKKCRTLNINTVPSEGLILHHPRFDTYNMTRCNMANLPYIEYEDIKQEVEKFKKSVIYPEIRRSIECKIWEGWLETMKVYPFYLENQLEQNGEQA